MEILEFGSKIQGPHMEFWRNGRYLRAAPALRRMAAPARGAAPARREKSGISRPLECNSTVFSVIQTHVVVLVDVTVHTFTLKVAGLLFITLHSLLVRVWKVRSLAER